MAHPSDLCAFRRIFAALILCAAHMACPGGGSYNVDTSTSAGDPTVVNQVPTDTTPQANPNTPADPNVVALGFEGDGEFVIGPNYAWGPEWKGADANNKGVLATFTTDSQNSNYYTGLDPNLNNPHTFTRNGWVYTPSGYKAGTEIPFIVVQDGGHYKGWTTALDYLILKRQIPPMAAIFIDPGPGDSFGSERGLEYDTVSPTYGEYVQNELLPYVRQNYQLNLTDDANGRATAGCSSGGAAAFTMAWFHPEWFSRVLSYSGTFVHQHTDADFPHGAWSYHESLILASERKNIRVAFEVGQNDLSLEDRNDGMHSWAIANGRMSVCLRAKGYHYKYYYALNAGHVDGGAVQQTLGEALIWLWRGYPIP